MSETIDRLTKVFRDVFDDDEIEVSRETTAKDIEGWDSLGRKGVIPNCFGGMRTIGKKRKEKGSSLIVLVECVQ